MTATPARSLLTAALFAVMLAPGSRADTVDLGPRPHFLVQQMQDGPLKQALQACS